MTKSNQNVIKHCEYCGEIVEVPFWSALFSTDYIIYLKNSEIERVDKENMIVYLRSGERFNYLFGSKKEDILDMPFMAKIHLLCSEKCEDNFVLRTRHFLSGDLYRKTPIFSFRENKMFHPSAAPIKNFSTILKKCYTCNLEYPEFDDSAPKLWRRIWMCQEIITATEVYGKYNERPNIDSKYQILVSGMSEKSPTGVCFCYEPGELHTQSFCSVDCAYVYSVKNNCIVTYASVLDKDRYGAITPATEKINKDLMNLSPHRPSFIGYV